MGTYSTCKNLKPDLNNFKGWESRGHTKILDLKQNKLDSRSIRCDFISYPIGSKGYRF